MGCAVRTSFPVLVTVSPAADTDQPICCAKLTYKTLSTYLLSMLVKDIIDSSCGGFVVFLACE